MDFITSNIGILLLAAGILAGFVVLYMHQKHISGTDLMTAFRSDPKGTAVDVFNIDHDYLLEQFNRLHERLDPKPFPGVGASFVDLFDVGEQYGLSGIKQGVVLDGEPVRTGADPVILLRRIDGKGISRVA